jgi:N-acetylglutamate synthase-like GNAT family acetyltransferase
MVACRQIPDHPKDKSMIRRCSAADFDAIFEIINDAAQAYNGVIPEDCWHEPYMGRDELARQIEDGIMFWGLEQNSELVGIMGIQDKGEVSLIRHAYVRTRERGRGVGTALLQMLEGTTSKPILIGTWAAAYWAIGFYQKNGYRQVSEQEKTRLLHKFWSIPERQVETSVVLAGPGWIDGS